MTDTAALRSEVVRVAREMSRSGLSRGRSGNVSVRAEPGMLITPSALAYASMEPGDVAHVDLGGRVQAGERRPSTEWPMHAAIYRTRRDAGAVVHTHSPFATALACMRRDIPALHYMVALAGGDAIRCSRYAPFGSEELAGAALDALGYGRACLLANHGVIALGASADAALELAGEVETLAELYWRTLVAGGPTLLSAAEMDEARRRFADYQPPEGS